MFCVLSRYDVADCHNNCLNRTVCTHDQATRKDDDTKDGMVW